jgi:hypothetical protein
VREQAIENAKVIDKKFLKIVDDYITYKYKGKKIKANSNVMYSRMRILVEIFGYTRDKRSLNPRVCAFVTCTLLYIIENRERLDVYQTGFRQSSLVFSTEFK